MAIRFSSVFSSAKQVLKRNQQAIVPKGHIPVYVGEESDKRRYVIPLSCLSHPAFQDLLEKAEQVFGFNHPMGVLTIPCSEATFFELTSNMKC